MHLWLSYNPYLDVLATKHRTDKGPAKTMANAPKAYTKYYSEWFDLIREEPLNFLEIGVQSGASVRMWKEYFPKGNIYGIDINPKCKRYEEERIVIFTGDQGDKNFLKRVVNTIGGPIHIVLDDGGHKSQLHIASFEVLFPHVISGGLYIIEDLFATSGDVSLSGKNNTTHNYFKNEVDRLMKGKIAEQTDIEGISFYRPKTSGAMMMVQKR